MTEHPDGSRPTASQDPAEGTDPAAGTGPVGPAEPADSAGRSATKRRRVRRRAERPGTNPTADDAPDVVVPRTEPGPGETQHDRWLREQRPPHWE